MNCSKCGQELPSDARFCSSCSTAVPQRASIEVRQEAGQVAGEMVGVIIGGAPPAGLSSATHQKFGTIEAGGSGVGTIVGGGAPIHVGGQQDYSREETHVSGNQYNMSGDFRSAILNIESTLTNVTQSIGAAPVGDDATKAKLKALIEELSVELQKVPEEKAADAEQAAKRAESAVAEAAKPNPDKDDVEYSLSRLKKAAENIAQVLPTVLPIATQIATMLRGMIGL